MDFGKSILQKYGWKEGSGLGKNSDGITKPIKANLKFDKAGLGESKSEEFTNLWWERAFNEAARNIEVSEEGENVTIGVKDKDSVGEFFSKNLAKTFAQNFIKKSVLNGSRVTHENSSDNKPSEPDLPEVKAYPYEEWFEACGGMTAHKGARHGLTLRGKLYRIQQQEQELKAGFEQAQKYLNARNWPYSSVKSQKLLPALELVNNDYQSLKKKNKDKNDDVELNSVLDTSTQDLMLPKEKKKRKKVNSEQCTQTWISESVVQNTPKKENSPKKSIRDNPPNKIKKKKKVKKFADKSTMI